MTLSLLGSSTAWSQQVQLFAAPVNQQSGRHVLTFASTKRLFKIAVQLIELTHFRVMHENG